MHIGQMERQDWILLSQGLYSHKGIVKGEVAKVICVLLKGIIKGLISTKWQEKNHKIAQ